jgi:hypothetical protein
VADVIQVTVNGTATTADPLSATQLDPIPYDGTLEVYMASTQADTTLAIKIADELVQDARPLPLRTSGMPNMSDDAGITQNVINGQKARLAIVVVTGATWNLIVRLVPA